MGIIFVSHARFCLYVMANHTSFSNANERCLHCFWEVMAIIFFGPWYIAGLNDLSLLKTLIWLIFVTSYDEFDVPFCSRIPIALDANYGDMIFNFDYVQFTLLTTMFYYY